jgi:hypothetical protein
MKKNQWLWILFILLITSCESLQEVVRIINEGQESIANNSCHEASNYICEIEMEIHRLVNQRRRREGKSTVSQQLFIASVNRQWNSDRYREGKFHLEGLTNRIYNAYSNKFEKNDIFITHGHGCSGSMNECNEAEIRTAKTVAQRIVNDWMAKSEPRANLLSDRITWQATGVIIRDKIYFATQIMGRESN